MPQDEHVQGDIAAIRTRLDQIESMQRLLVSSNKAVKEFVRDVLERRDNAAELVMLLGEGPLRQDEIIARLKKSQATVSKVLGHLGEAGLLMTYADPAHPRKMRWGLNDLEVTVNLTRIAKDVLASRPKSAG